MGVGMIGTGPLTVSSNATMGPAQERLTLQQEANDITDRLRHMHAILDQMLGIGQTPTDQPNPVLPPLGASLANARSESVRMVERLSSLVDAVGQV